MEKKVVILIGIAALLNGCASLERTTLLGAGVGAATGTGIGLAASNNATGALTGAAVGAVLGSAFFYLGGKDKEEKTMSLKAMLKSKDKPQDLPYIKAPSARCVRLEEKIDGTIYYGPQLKCTIENQANWAR